MKLQHQVLKGFGNKKLRFLRNPSQCAKNKSSQNSKNSRAGGIDVGKVIRMESTDIPVYGIHINSGKQ